MQFAVSKTGRILRHGLKMIKSQGLSYKMPGNYIIDSKKLGNKDVTFTFINDDHIKLNYTYQIEVVKCRKVLGIS